MQEQSDVKQDSEKIMDFLYANPNMIPNIKEKIKIFEEKNETYFTWQVRNVPTSLHKQFKSTCAKKKKSLRNVIVTMMREFVKEGE